VSPNPLWTIGEAQAEAAERAKADAVVARMFAFRETARHAVYGPYGYVGSSRVDKPTHDAVMMAHYLAGERYEITQGGLNAGAVSASASTHNGLGVLDTRRAGVGMTMADAFRVVSFGMDCGMHGMIRGVEGVDNMVDHIHWARLGARAVMHPSAYASVYNRTYGTMHGGGGLGGAPRTRWYGPPLKPETTWAKSKYNPTNGWRP